MSIILKQPITGPAAWSGPDLENETSWLRPLTPDIIDGLDSALAALKAKGLRFPDFTREDFVETQLQFAHAVFFFSRPMRVLAGRVSSAQVRLPLLENDDLQLVIAGDAGLVAFDMLTPAHAMAP